MTCRGALFGTGLRVEIEDDVTHGRAVSHARSEARSTKASRRPHVSPVAVSHWLRYGWAFRLSPAADAGAAHGFVDNVLGHISQLAVLRLAHRPQLGERVLGGAP